MDSKIPLVALRDTIVFPDFSIPLFVGRPKSIKAIEKAFEGNGLVVFVTQKNPNLESVTPDDLFRFGTVSRINQMVKLTDGTTKILIEGLSRATIDEILDDGEMMYAEVTEISSEKRDENQELDALHLAVLSNFKEFFKHDKKLSTEVFEALCSIEDSSKMADAVDIPDEKKV